MCLNYNDIIFPVRQPCSHFIRQKKIKNCSTERSQLSALMSRTFHVHVLPICALVTDYGGYNRGSIAFFVICSYFNACGSMKHNSDGCVCCNQGQRVLFIHLGKLPKKHVREFNPFSNIQLLLVIYCR